MAGFANAGLPALVLAIVANFVSCDEKELAIICEPGMYKDTSRNCKDLHQKIQEPFSITLTCGWSDAHYIQSMQWFKGFLNGSSIKTENTGIQTKNTGIQTENTGIQTENTGILLFTYIPRTHNLTKHMDAREDMSVDINSFSMTLANTSVEDTAVYTCRRILHEFQISDSYVKLSVRKEPQVKDNHKRNVGLDILEVVGLSIGSVLLCTIVIALVVIFWRLWMKREFGSKEEEGEEDKAQTQFHEKMGSVAKYLFQRNLFETHLPPSHGIETH